MNKKQINKKANIVLMCTLIALCLSGIILYQKHITKQTQSELRHNEYVQQANKVKKLYKEKKVTKALLYATKKNHLNVKFYDENNINSLDYDLLKNKIKTNELKTISILMYSDGCPRCNKEKEQLAKYITKHSNGSNLILAINRLRGNNRLENEFQLPKYYHYPSHFIYTDDFDDNGKFVLIASKFLNNLND